MYTFLYVLYTIFRTKYTYPYSIYKMKLTKEIYKVETFIHKPMLFMSSVFVVQGVGRNIAVKMPLKPLEGRVSDI